MPWDSVLCPDIGQLIFFILGHVTESRAIEYFGVCYGACDQGALVLLCCSPKAPLIRELALLSGQPFYKQSEASD